MCLAIPGKVLSIDTATKPVMGRVSFSGVVKDICLDWTPEVQVGQYVIVHVGFSISTMDESEARETLRLLREVEESQKEDER